MTEPSAERLAQETTAKNLGWSPQDKFRGDPKDWLDAPEYIQKVNETFPVLRERARTLGQRLQQEQQNNASLHGRISELTQTLEEFRAFSDKREERAYKKARADIQAEMDAAVDRSDPQAYKEAQRRMSSLDDEVRERAEEIREEARARQRTTRTNGDAPVVVSAEVQEWLTANPWFNEDPEMNAIAVMAHARLKKEMPGLTLTENLERVRNHVRDTFPKKFGIDPDKAAGDDRSARVSPPSGREDERGTRRRAAPKVKTYDDLPADAKAQCDRFIKNKMVKDRESYTKEYFEQDEANSYEVVGE